MNFEILKKNHKRQIVIGAIAICVIGGALTFATTRAKYKLTEDLELAKGTVNYKPYDFKVMAMYKSDDKTNYIEINEMPSSGYTINESKSYCNMSDGNKDTTAILKTIDGNHTIGKLKKNDRCYLYFDKELKGSEAILGNVTVNTGTPNFSQVATTDEGVYKVSDPVYGENSYYFRGAVTNNYVKFGDFCWRIVRINGDGSIRLIYDGATCHANGTNTTESIIMTNQRYNSSTNQLEYVGWTYTLGEQRTLSGTASNAKTKVEEWYNNNINETNKEKVADGKYCNDRNSASGSSWSSKPSGQFSYAAYGRLFSNKTPTLSCNSGDVYTLKVGLITADEVAFAGGVYNTTNDSYYLYNGQNYWSMTPARWDTDTTSSASMFYLYSGKIWCSGFLGLWYDKVASFGLRPVINLKNDVKFSGGNGTLNSPYVVS